MLQRIPKWVLLFCIASMVNAQNDPEITTKSGSLRGFRQVFEGVNIDTYLGIPYAEKPLGDLRFRKPLPVSPWSETKVVTELPPACPQHSPTPYPWMYNLTEHQDEDCLYLNIWVPSSQSKEKLAVMFFIHGGGFYLGSSRDFPTFDGKALASLGNVIVVTINYRLGAPGFLYTETEEASGNSGMYDMLLALEWVNKNIAAFNGNKDEITIFGQSAGAIAVSHLCVSNLTDGLFKRAIIQSGSSFSLFDGKDTNLDIGQKMAEYVECADEKTTIYDNPELVIDCLHDLSAQDIADAIGTIKPHSTATFLPIFGDPIVGMNPIESLRNGRFKDIDILIGNVKHEGAYMVTTDNCEKFGCYGEKNAVFNKSFATDIIRNAMSPMPVRDEIIDYYLGDLEDDDYDRIRNQTFDASGDFVLICPTIYFANVYEKNNNRVFFYSFEHRPSNSRWAPVMGVVHYDDVPFVFGVPIQQPKKYLQSEVALSREMIKIWTDFAKTGNPGDNWPLYGRDKPIVRALTTNNEKVYKESPFRKNCDFVMPYLEAADYTGNST